MDSLVIVRTLGAYFLLFEVQQENRHPLLNLGPRIKKIAIIAYLDKAIWSPCGCTGKEPCLEIQVFYGIVNIQIFTGTTGSKEILVIVTEMSYTINVKLFVYTNLQGEVHFWIIAPYNHLQDNVA